MTDQDVRAYLRGATKSGILKGWNNFNRFVMGEGVVLYWTATVTETGRSGTYTGEEIREYCAMLKEGGIEPIYLHGSNI